MRTWAARLLAGLVIGLLVVLAGGMPTGSARAGHQVTIAVHEATLVTAQGSRPVSLPHVLEAGDFPASGGRVVYRVPVNLRDLPAEGLGIYVSKLSLSGAVSLNGHGLGACEPAPLEMVRCLHRPYLFVPPPSLWQQGLNQIEFEIYANDRQMNGLSRIEIGPAAVLAHGPYLWKRLWQVELLRALTWVTLCLGLLSLTVAAILRDDRLALWFGLSAISNAAANVNVLITAPILGPEAFSWFVFSVRMVSVPLMILTLVSFYEQPGKWLVRGLVGYAVLMPVVVALSQNSRFVVQLLYLPLLIMVCVLAVAMLRWTWRSRRPLHVLVTMVFVFLALIGAADFARLGGRANFDGVYLLAYGSALVLLLFGGVLLTRLAGALRTERELAARLDAEVARRTTELEQANRRLAEIAITDGLTGIPNRRRFDEVLAFEWQHARREQRPLALLMLDIDHFKEYNDQHGHQAGDDVLRLVASTLRGHVKRGTDLAARYGGEEFAIIVGADAEGALRLAESIRAAIEAMKLPHRTAPRGYVTVSLGVAARIPRPDGSLEDFLYQADAALYRAKGSGRNRVELAVA